MILSSLLSSWDLWPDIVKRKMPHVNSYIYKLHLQVKLQVITCQEEPPDWQTWGRQCQGCSKPIDPLGPGLQIFGLIPLLIVINYALLGWAKKLKSWKCWWGQCILVMCAIFRICGDESQPNLQLVKKLATPLTAIILPSAPSLYQCTISWVVKLPKAT